MSVNFTYHSYLISFAQSGLPASDAWYVNITGGPSLLSTGVTTTQSTDLINGSYTFHAGTNDTRYAPSYSPAFTVSGEPVLISVNFTLLTDTVTISETGLPSGTPWNTTVNGITLSSTNHSILFQEANGTFDYRTGVPAGGWTSGTFTVDGGPISVQLAFYRISFTEGKLPGRNDLAGHHERGDGPFDRTALLLSAQWDLPLSHRGGRWLPHDRFWCVLGGGGRGDHPLGVPTDHLFHEILRDRPFVGDGLVRDVQRHARVLDEGQRLVLGDPQRHVQLHDSGPSRTMRWAHRYSGTVLVTGGGQGTTPDTVSVAWTLVKYLVKFTETGLPHATDWSVTIAWPDPDDHGNLHLVRPFECQLRVLDHLVGIRYLPRTPRAP